MLMNYVNCGIPKNTLFNKGELPNYFRPWASQPPAVPSVCPFKIEKYIAKISLITSLLYFEDFDKSIPIASAYLTSASISCLISLYSLSLCFLRSLAI
jgi:hypothetical protein